MARLKDPRERELSWQLGERTVEINISRGKECKLFESSQKHIGKSLRILYITLHSFDELCANMANLGSIANNRGRGRLIQ